MENDFEVAVSYAQESEEYTERVISFVNFLRENGFNCGMDMLLKQQNTSIDFNEMMVTMISKTPKVIVILSKTYKRKAENFEGGVGKEYRIINNEIIDNKNKYILASFDPLKGDSYKDLLPKGLDGREIIDLVEDKKNSYQLLFSKLKSEPIYEFAPVSDKKAEVKTHKVKDVFSNKDVKEESEEKVEDYKFINPISELMFQEKWIDREDVYEKLGDIAKNKLWLIEGFEKSGKVLTVQKWLIKQKVRKQDIFYCKFVEELEPSVFREIMKDFLKENKGHKKYVLLDDFTNCRCEEYYVEFMELVNSTNDLKLFVFSESVYAKISDITKYKDCIHIEMSGLEKSQIRPYFKMYHINIKDLDLIEIEKLGFLPGRLKQLIDCINENKVSVKRAVELCKSDKYSIEKIDQLEADAKKMAGYLALIGQPFSKKFYEDLGDELIKDKTNLYKLINQKVVTEYSDYSYEVPTFYSDLLVSNLSDEERKNACVRISNYYINAFSCAKLNLTNFTSRLHCVTFGVNACHFAHRAGKYDMVNPILADLIKQAKKCGTYESMCNILLEQLKCSTLEEWNLYHLLHILTILGRHKEVKNIVESYNLDKITDYDCRLGITRLKYENLLGQIPTNACLFGLKTDFDRMCQDRKTSQEYMLRFTIIMMKFLLEKYDAMKADLNAIEEELKLNPKGKTDYSLANFKMYTMMLNRKLGKQGNESEYKEIKNLYKRLGDERGTAWADGEWALVLLKEKRTKEAKNFIERSIIGRKEIKECSFSYKCWLLELNEENADTNIKKMIEEESHRLHIDLEKDPKRTNVEK